MGSCVQSLQTHGNGSELYHVRFGLTAILRKEVHRPDPICQQADLISQCAGIFDRIQYTIIGRQAPDKQTADPECLQMAVQRGVFKGRIRLLVRIDGLIDEDGGGRRLKG